MSSLLGLRVRDRGGKSLLGWDGVALVEFFGGDGGATPTSAKEKDDDNGDLALEVLPCGVLAEDAGGAPCDRSGTLLLS